MRFLRAGPGIDHIPGLRILQPERSPLQRSVALIRLHETDPDPGVLHQKLVARDGEIVRFGDDLIILCHRKEHRVGDVACRRGDLLQSIASGRQTQGMRPFVRGPAVDDGIVRFSVSPVQDQVRAGQGISFFVGLRNRDILFQCVHERKGSAVIVLCERGAVGRKLGHILGQSAVLHALPDRKSHLFVAGNGSCRLPLLSVHGVGKHHHRVPVFLVGLPFLPDRDVSVGGDMSGVLLRGGLDLDGEAPALGARHIVAVLSRDHDLIRLFFQPHGNAEGTRVRVEVGADPVRKIDVEVFLIVPLALTEGDIALPVLDGKVPGAEFQHPGDIRPEAGGLHGGAQHQGGIVQDCLRTGRDFRSVQVLGVMGIDGLHGLRLRKEGRIRVVISSSAERKLEIEGDGVADVHFQRRSVLLLFLKFFLCIFFPVDRDGDRGHVLHQVDVSL